MSEQIRIKPGGDWHSRERIDGGRETSCGKAIFVVASRDGGLDALCPRCFTPEEIRTGEFEKLKIDHADEDDGLYHHDEDEPTDPGE